MRTGLTVRGGTDREGRAEAISFLAFGPGESLAVVGPTGSGKSEFLADVEQAAAGDTPSGRIVAFYRDGKSVSGPGLAATLSQRTHFVMDAGVGEFLRLHAASLGKDASRLAGKTVALANTLCGEPMSEDSLLQRLSGGQSRALMIADIALVSDAPVVLIDEVENAGIDKHLAVEILSGHGKITVIATHDPVLMLSGQKRLIMKEGGMRSLHEIDAAERLCLDRLNLLDKTLISARERLRAGERLQEDMFACFNPH
ncbi:MAG: ATP-binding cassette domain-containing protein [Desulfovibrio sp.]|jgi:ABC-type lipoprotein export system ATPase subunit|nr:ATP-binding cassette domain-containing protein [Desulfovibrio sp.]